MDQCATKIDQSPVKQSPNLARDSALPMPIKTSPARRRNVVPSPPSPTKSITGAVVAQSPTFKGAFPRTVNSLWNVTNEYALPSECEGRRYDDNTQPALNESKHNRLLHYSPGFVDKDTGDIELCMKTLEPEQRQKLSSTTLHFETGDDSARLNDSHGQIPYTNLNVSETINSDHYRRPTDYNKRSRSIGNTHYFGSHNQPSIDAESFDLPGTYPFPSFETWIPPHDQESILDFINTRAPAFSPNSLLLRSSKEDHTVELYHMMLEANQTALQAILGNHSNISQPQSNIDSSRRLGVRRSNSEAAIAPKRPSRPASNHGSFITTANSAVNAEHRSSVSKSPSAPPLTIPPFSIDKAKNVRSSSSYSAPERGNKHVHLAPPPLPLHNLAHEQFTPPKIRTPFPFSTLATTGPSNTSANATISQAQETSCVRLGPLKFDTHRPTSQDFVHKSYVSTDTLQSPAAELLIFIRRRYAPFGLRTTCIVIPRESHFAKSTSPSAVGKNEKHFLSLDFDDAVFLKQMRRQYYHVLLGDNSLARLWRRICSARVLKCIKISNLDTRRCSKDCNANTDLRTNDVLLKDLVRNFHTPILAKGCYTWVQWAQRIASLETARRAVQNTAPPGSETSMPQTECESAARPGITGSVHEFAKNGLEFIEGWSIWRILLALLVTFLASMAACLFWIFFGPDVDAGDTTFQGLSETARAARVLTGCGIGILVLLLGWTLMGAWIGLSYLVMSAGCEVAYGRSNE